jgi:carboxyl-terminal processing protease
VSAVNVRWIAALCVAAGLLVGLYLGGHPDDLPGPVRDIFVSEKAGLTAEVLDTVDDNYWKSVDNGPLEEASARGIINRLRKSYDDRFSHYFNAKQFEEFKQATEGAFSGVGLGVSEVPQGLRVSETFPGSPAKAAGIKRGDLVIAVNGRPLAGVDSAVATGLIKGDAGTSVTITVKSKGAKPRDIELKRARIDVPVVDGHMVKAAGRPVGYVRMASFTPGVHGALRKEIEKLRGQGAQGLILDLRNNGGGLLQEAVLTSSIFLDEGVVVSTDSRTQGTHVYKAVGDALPRQPTVVLTNKDTASAAEILTAALAENGLATTVGTTTYGKGVFQQVIPLDEGGGLDLTIGEYLTSNGTSIAGKGIVPEVKVADDPKQTGDEVQKRARAVLGQELGQ